MIGFLARLYSAGVAAVFAASSRLASAYNSLSSGVVAQPVAKHQVPDVFGDVRTEYVQVHRRVGAGEHSVLVPVRLS